MGYRIQLESRAALEDRLVTNSVRAVSVVVILAFTILLGSCSSIEHTIACDVGINDNSHCTCGPCPVTPGPEFLYATSQNTNQISTFSIDHTSGVLGAAVSTPAPAGAVGIAVSQNQFLYISDTGGGDIYAFSIDQTTGVLTAVAGSPYFALGQTSFAPEDLVAGTSLYATSIDGITGFTIASDGSLTTVPGSPFSSATIGGATLGQSNTAPVNYFLYASDFADPNGTISAYTIDPTTGILTAVPGSFTTGTFTTPNGITFAGSSSNQFVFVGLESANQIAVFSVDPSTGTLTAAAGSPFPVASQPTSLALNSAQNVLYSLSFLGGNISAFSIGSDGTLTPVTGSPFVPGGLPGSMAVTQDNYMYVSLPASNSIVGYSIGADGSLTTLAGSPFPASGAAALTVVQIPPP